MYYPVFVNGFGELLPHEYMTAIPDNVETFCLYEPVLVADDHPTGQTIYPTYRKNSHRHGVYHRQMRWIPQEAPCTSMST